MPPCPISRSRAYRSANDVRSCASISMLGTNIRLCARGRQGSGKTCARSTLPARPCCSFCSFWIAEKARRGNIELRVETPHHVDAEGALSIQDFRDAPATADNGLEI